MGTRRSAAVDAPRPDHLGALTRSAAWAAAPGDWIAVGTRTLIDEIAGLSDRALAAEVVRADLAKVRADVAAYRREVARLRELVPGEGFRTYPSGGHDGE
ncbi:hypothetical protein [Gemmata sp.]|uniref:hypothetical protein n=1 Tax=Gemmata sp. TaxID=1914242 RepID=UPI003F705EFA